MDWADLDITDIHDLIATDPLVRAGSLVLLFIMCFLASGIVPMPVTSYIFWLGQFEFSPWVVVVGAIGSVCGWPLTAKYLRLLLDKKPNLSRRIPDIYRRFFMRWMGVSVFLCNALPLPWDPSRLLTLIYGYSQKRTLIAIGLARLVRNTILVTLGAALAPYKMIFWGVLIGLMIVPLLINKLYLALRPPQAPVLSLDPLDVVDMMEAAPTVPAPSLGASETTGEEAHKPPE